MARKQTIGWKNSEGVEYIVKFTYDGKYYPATREDPEEVPELVVLQMIDVNTGKDLLENELTEEPQELREYLENNHPYNS